MTNSMIIKAILPSNCIFHPNNDIYQHNEKNKIKINNHQWQCLYCKKVPFFRHATPTLVLTGFLLDFCQ